MPMKHKAVEWLGRYLPAELGGTLGAIAGGLLVHIFTSNTALIALGGTWGENVGYYLVIIVRDSAHYTAQHTAGTGRRAYIVARNLIVEFGLAEVLDSCVVRPFLLYLALVFIHNLPLGLVVGKIAADAVFYTIAIGMYEYRKAYLHD